jgi:heptosyltransferase-2
MIELQRGIDRYLGGLLCILFAVISKLLFFIKPAEKFNKILVIRLWAVGEAVLTLPMIHALRKKFPKAEITVLCRKRVKDVFYGNKDVDDLLLFEPRNIFSLLKNIRHFDVSFDTEPFFRLSALLGLFFSARRIGFSGSIRSLLYTDKVKFNDRQHEVLTFLDLSRQLDAHYMPKNLVSLNYSKDDKKAVEKILKENKIAKNDFVIGITPGTAESARFRMWPKERFAELADILVKKYNAKIVFVGAKSDENVIKGIQEMMKRKSVSLAGKTTLRQTFYLVKKCRIFISNDTGPMHIAAAQGVKTIGLFGPNLPDRFAPYGPKNISVYRKADCSPCINVHLGQIPRECKRKKNKYLCMNLIWVNEVLEAVKRIK